MAQKHKNTKRFLFIFLGVFIIIFSLGYKLIPQKQVVDMTDWKSFTSSLNGFALKAPSTFTLRKGGGNGDSIVLDQQYTSDTHQSVTPLTLIAAGYMLNNQLIVRSCVVYEDGFNEFLTVAKAANQVSHGKTEYSIFPTTILGKTIKGIAMLTPADINAAEKTNIPAYVDEDIVICYKGKLFDFHFVINGDLQTFILQQPIINTILSSFKFIN